MQLQDHLLGHIQQNIPMTAQAKPTRLSESLPLEYALRSQHFLVGGTRTYEEHFAGLTDHAQHGGFLEKYHKNSHYNLLLRLGRELYDVSNHMQCAAFRVVKSASDHSIYLETRDGVGIEGTLWTKIATISPLSAPLFQITHEESGEIVKQGLFANGKNHLARLMAQAMPTNLRQRYVEGYIQSYPSLEIDIETLLYPETTIESPGNEPEIAVA